jgi:anti-sigma B factor antagonist
VDARIDVHTDDPQRVVVAVVGEIDLATRDKLESAIVTAIGVAGSDHKVIVDLAQTTFLDSTGIAVLVRGREAAAEANTHYSINGAYGMVRHVLELTGVLAVLTQDPDIDLALE